MAEVHPNNDPPAPSTHDTPASHSAHPLPYPFTTTTPPPTLIAQGAEALLYRTCYLDPSRPAALKVRPSKKYRHRILDERLTKQRVLAEARVLVKLGGVADREGWAVPAVWGVEWDVGRKVRGLPREIRPVGQTGAGTMEGEEVAEESGESNGKGAWLLMEWVEGKTVKELVREWDAWWRGKGLTAQEKAEGEEEMKGLLRRMGRAVAGMHARGGVVHGDLTSSNIIIRRVGATADGGGQVEQANVGGRPNLSGEVVLIDFGLATQAIQDEDRAVDLYVLERAFGSTHPRQEQWFDQEVLQSQEGYRGVWKGAPIVLKRLDEVRLRGRKRSMIG
ncbi:Kae1-associated kinase Bud32 [Cyphellophora europaea CBS 101466]|uniref:EKC/KEOPS complex subunit BUD32 n=1 Tax=Cyphellophora europaea (strain CBS 101466) TaxID=1220924 RepID=W2S4A4_CYPE1|nr:Kae1-associated kinase Bud32 [Cyphellophora europaea CBS 101466]ETN43536.1 Kae1-associated kinase Bud32 [Cyphellophora europaea CBS 101466]